MIEDSSVEEEEGITVEKQMARNWVTIVYQNQWDAARAVRKSGTVQLLDGNVLIGAKWAVRWIFIAFDALLTDRNDTEPVTGTLQLRDPHGRSDER